MAEISCLNSQNLGEIYEECLIDLHGNLSSPSHLHFATFPELSCSDLVVSFQLLNCAKLFSASKPLSKMFLLPVRPFPPSSADQSISWPSRNTQHYLHVPLGVISVYFLVLIINCNLNCSMFFSYVMSFSPLQWSSILGQIVFVSFTSISPSAWHVIGAQ